MSICGYLGERDATLLVDDLGHLVSDENIGYAVGFEVVTRVQCDPVGQVVRVICDSTLFHDRSFVHSDLKRFD